MNLASFFDAVRETVFRGKLKQEQVDGCGTLIAAFEQARWPVAHAAYALATAFHETAHTMQPIREFGRGKSRKYGIPGKHGQVAYGRGYVQLTWDYNYEKADKELGLKGMLNANYDLAMRPDIAAAIMVRGMQEGWFTGKANKTYLDKVPPDYINARRIINGLDKAALIAGYAAKFEVALNRAGYGAPVMTTISSPGIEVERLPKEPYPTPIDAKPGGAQTAMGNPIPEPNQRVEVVSAAPRRTLLQRLSSIFGSGH